VRAGIEPLESRLLLSSTQLIRNGGFEGTVSSSDWVLSGSLQADSRFTQHHTGTGYAYLANPDGTSGNNLSGSIYQQVTIPSTASSLTLDFWTSISTSETTTTNAYDLMSVQVLNASGTTVLQNVGSFSNLSASSGYVLRSFSLSRSLIGQTVRLQFSASTDNGLPTTFRMDDVSLNAVSPAIGKRVVGYLPEYEYSTVFSKLDFGLLTHANYFSISANTDGTLNTGNVNASHLNSAVGAFHAAGDTISITVGFSFKTLANNATARAAFANNIVNYALAHNLDGIDIDWEPPAGNSYAPYGLLISDLYAKAHPQHMLITAAVNPWTNEIPVNAVNTYMDWLNVMCYDFAPANHSTYSDSVSGMVDWTNYGVVRSKLVMGVPFYGRSGTTWDNTVSKTYNSILNDYRSLHGAYPPPGIDSYAASSGATYYFNGVTTIEKKAAYVRDNGYGGMMTWELGQDHFDSSGNYDSYSLLPVMSSMMRPPGWLAPATGSTFDLVNSSLILGAGRVTFIGDASATHPGLNLIIPSGASASFNVNQRLGGLSISGTGMLDLKTSDLILEYSGSSPMGSWNGTAYTGILGLVQRGRNGGTWDGSGIRSSSASGNTYAIGAAEAWQVFGISGAQTANFDGRQVDATTVLVKFTYAGDANLDGRINIDDYGRIDANVGSSGATFGWYAGDFNLDGKINIDDYGLIDSIIGAQGSPL
jgi:chitinase